MYIFLWPEGTEGKFIYLNSIFLLQHKVRKTRLTPDITSMSKKKTQ